MSLGRKVALNTSLFAAGRLFGAVAGVIATAIATRYLGPDRFGSLTVAVVFGSILMLLCDLGLWTTTARDLSRAPEREAALIRNVIGLALLVAAVVGALALVVIFTVYGGHDRVLAREGMAIMLGPLLVAVPGGVALAWFTARQRALPIVAAGIAGNALLVVGLVAAATFHLGFRAIAIVYAVAVAVSVVGPLAMGRGILRRPSFDPDAWRAILRSALPQGAVIAVGVLYFRVDTIMLSLISTNRQVALYGVAYRVVEALTLLPVYLMFTFFREIARAAPHSEDLRTLVQGAFSAVQVALLPMLLVFVGFAEEIVAAIGGHGFSGAVPLLRLLMVSVALGFVNGVFIQSLVALGKQVRLAVLLLLVLAGNVLLNAALIPLWDARGAAVALIASELMALGLLVRAFREVGSLPRLFRPLRLALAGALTALLLLLKLIPWSADVRPWATLVLAVGLVAPLYLTVLLRLRAMPEGIEALLPAALRRLGPRAAPSA